MHRTPRVTAWAAVFSISVAAVISCPSPARAQAENGFTCQGGYDYVPPVYTGLNPGDAVLIPTAPNGADPISELFQKLSLNYTHVMLAWDSSGVEFAESQWDGNPPPSTHSTGGSHACSRVLDSARLQSLNPGTTGTATYDPSHVLSGARIIQQLGTPYCNSPADHYHFNSFIHDDVLGGSCEKYVADYCGVPVQPGDKVVRQGSDMNAALVGAYQVAYQAAIGMTADLPWYDYAACGGVDSTILAQRASMQVMNEIRWKWYDLLQPNGNTTDYLGLDTNAEGVTTTAPGGWWQWENLGGASQNTQWTGPGYATIPGDYCTNVNISYQTPNGALQDMGADCPSWNNYGDDFTMNVPDDVENANTNHEGHLEYQANVSGGYWVYDPNSLSCSPASDGGYQACGDNGMWGMFWNYCSYPCDTYQDYMYSGAQPSDCCTIYVPSCD